MKLKIILFLLVLFPLNTVTTATAGILGSKHDLSMTGGGMTGGVAALTEKRVCVFCHTPHNALTNANAPLWNRTSTVATYTPYSSLTIHFTPGKPTGSSILCLSCHDGTIAIGSVVTSGPAAGGAILMQRGVTTMPLTSKSFMGTDLSNDHPISFQYTSKLATDAGELVQPAALPREVKLDGNSELQCTTCHDAHNDINGQFLVMSNRGSALCEACHVKSLWTNSPHNTSGGTWNGVLPDPWPNSTFTTVTENACGNCHAAHNAGVKERLFTQSKEEVVCFVCHNGNVGGLKNIQADFMIGATVKSAHPLALATGIHQPYLNNAELPPIKQRHVECIDCHNAHEGRTDPVNAVGISGIDWQGIALSPIADLYQLCFKCHESSLNRAVPLIPRTASQLNVRLQFDQLNPSYHPITAVAKISSASLLPPWIAGVAAIPGGAVPLRGVNIFTKSCFECHVDTPHGSPNVALLQLNMNITSGPESLTAYALCYSCHDRNIILGDTTFKEHNRHIVGEMASCVTCHDPHGASMAAGATITNNLRLINFSTTMVTGARLWTGTGNNMGSCTLVCHGENHAPETY
ncbi:MAG: cytochrome c3 family protein [Thiohalomonadales bacterium]